MSEVADQSAQTSMHGCPVSDSRGQVVLHAGRDAYIGVLKKLIDDGFTMCSDLTAVDYLTHAGRVLPPVLQHEQTLVELDAGRAGGLVDADDAALAGDGAAAVEVEFLKRAGRERRLREKRKRGKKKSRVGGIVRFENDRRRWVK